VAAFETKRPAAIIHRRCGRVILEGWSEGLRARVDLTTLQADLWPVAILRHVRLFWLHPTGLIYLDQHRLRHASRYPVLPWHWCALSWPQPPTEAITTDDQPCPF
jgi:hypothetical protein